MTRTAWWLRWTALLAFAVGAAEHFKREQTQKWCWYSYNFRQSFNNGQTSQTECTSKAHGGQWKPHHHEPMCGRAVCQSTKEIPSQNTFVHNRVNICNCPWLRYHPGQYHSAFHVVLSTQKTSRGKYVAPADKEHLPCCSDRIFWRHLWSIQVALFSAVRLRWCFWGKKDKGLGNFQTTVILLQVTRTLRFSCTG